MSLCATWRSRALLEHMSIGREESLFLTVSEDHRKREYPEYVQRMSAPFERAGGMAAVYEGVILGGADKIYGLDELNLWLFCCPLRICARSARCALRLRKSAPAPP